MKEYYFLGFIVFLFLIPSFVNVYADHASSISFKIPDSSLNLDFENDTKDQTKNYQITIHGEPEYVRGVNGMGLLLNDTEEITIFYDDLDVRTGFTVSLWLKLPYDSVGSILKKGSEFRLNAFPERSNEISVFVRVNGTNEPRVSSNYIPEKWQHWVVTWDTEDLKLFRDGMMISFDKRQGELDTDNSPLVIGRGMQVVIDEFSLYDKPLSNHEIFVLRYQIPFILLEIIVIISILIVSIILIKKLNIKQK